MEYLASHTCMIHLSPYNPFVYSGCNCIVGGAIIGLLFIMISISIVLLVLCDSLLIDLLFRL